MRFSALRSGVAVIASGVVVGMGAIPAVARADILVYDHNTHHNLAQQAALIIDPGGTVVAASGNFNALLVSQEWDAVAVDVPSTVPSEGWGALITFVNDGGRVAMAFWDWDDNGPGDPLLSPAFDVTPATKISLSGLTLFDSGTSSVFAGVTMPNSIWHSHWGDDGDEFIPDPGAVGLAHIGNLLQPVMVLGNSGRTIASFLIDEAGDTWLNDGSAVQLWENMLNTVMGGECGTGGPCVKGLECFTDCGELVQGVECVLFLADSGGLFLLDNLGGFNVGDQVEVTGCLDPGCFTICLEGDGCIFQNTIADCVIDDCSSFTCGQNNNKVLLCHVPPGNPGNAHTICISPSALPAHLAQHPGDHCGPCAAVQDAGDLGELPSVQVDVLSNLPGVFVNIGPPDMFDDGGGVVALERFYQPGSVVVLNAPKVFNGRAFLGWNVEGIGFDGWYRGTSLALPIIDGYTIEAVYCEPGFRSAPSSPRR